MADGKAGAPVGNTNSAKGRQWLTVLNRAIIQDDGKMLRQAADKLLAKAADGDLAAIAMLADRLDGRAAQSIMLQGDVDNPMLLVISHGMELDSDQLLDKIRGIEN